MQGETPPFLYELFVKPLHFIEKYITMNVTSYRGGDSVDWTGIYEMQQILDYIGQNFRENIGLEDVARSVGYSPRHCNAMFKSCYGETIAAYLRRLRMEAAKDELKRGASVKDISESLAFSSASGFRRAFREQFGIAPLAYLKGGELTERYVRTYEYKSNDSVWGSGSNPTPDGLWEYAYYDPAAKEYGLMDWNIKYFHAPFETADLSDRSWYCENRMSGYGMHPAKEVQAVRTFVCPHSGTVEILYSVGRICQLKEQGNPCTVQMFLNDAPLFPTEGPAVLNSTAPLFLFPTCTVRAGDRIQLRLDSMGDIYCDAVMLYRQQIGYLTVTDTKNEKG